MEETATSTPPTTEPRKPPRNAKALKPAPEEPAVAPSVQGARTIQVRLIKASTLQPFDLPGLMSNACTSRLHPTNGKGKRHEIEFVPALRGFRVRFFPPSGPTQEGYVPEQHVVWWEPVTP